MKVWFSYKSFVTTSVAALAMSTAISCRTNKSNETSNIVEKADSITNKRILQSLKSLHNFQADSIIISISANTNREAAAAPDINVGSNAAVNNKATKHQKIKVYNPRTKEVTQTIVSQDNVTSKEVTLQKAHRSEKTSEANWRKPAAVTAVTAIVCAAAAWLIYRLVKLRSSPP